MATASVAKYDQTKISENYLLEFGSKETGDVAEDSVAAGMRQIASGGRDAKIDRIEFSSAESGSDT